MNETYTIDVNNKTDLQMIRFRIDSQQSSNSRVNLIILSNSGYDNYVMTTSKNERVKVMSQTERVNSRDDQLLYDKNNGVIELIVYYDDMDQQLSINLYGNNRQGF